MKMTLKTLVVASAFAMAGAAQAAETITVDTSGPITSMNTKFSDLSGSGTLAFSELLLGALDLANIVTTGVAPAIVTMNEETFEIKAEAPVATLTGSNDGSTFSATKVGTLGGANMFANGLTAGGKKNSATTGGNLSVTNINVDLTTKAIYADLEGANGAGSMSQVHVWTFTDITGDPTSFATTDGAHVTNNVLSGLTITQPAFDMFATSLGLTTFGKNSMSGILDYGTITSQITVTTTAVPEPSTYGLMGAGFAVLAFAARRARRAA